MHWVEGSYNPDDRQRILLKCNYLVAPGNAARLLNNIHPLVPLALVAALLGTAGWGLVHLLG